MSWKTACEESAQEDFGHSPFDGGPTALYVARVGDPRCWWHR